MAKYIFYALFLELLFTGTLTRDPVSEQLQNYRKTHNGSTIIETQFGAPVPDDTSSLTAGPRGPILLQDVILVENLASFDRERIPERVVHALGAGAFGYFEVTKDITRYTKATVFKSVGKRTTIAVRFSVVSPERGGADTVRDPRGFAIKFYSDDGIWDLVGNNSPIFFIRDPMLFPSFIHVSKRNPVTNIKDSDMYWDFTTSRQETTYMTMYVFSDLGTPDGYRHMNGFGSHTFKMVNATGDAVYVKFHYLTDQGIKNLTSASAKQLAGTDPDYATRDLYNAIARGQFPSWTFYIQVMTFQQAEKFTWNPFDVTKIWPEDEFPLIEAGKLVLNENPENYFEQVEQIAFCPSHMIPGIEPSPDKMLQGRLFSYSDTQRYRLGVNHLQLAVNSPFRYRGVKNYQRDGQDAFYNQDGAPNYYPNSFGGPQNWPSAAISRFSVSGDVARYNSSNEDNFGQATRFWNKLTAEQKRNLEQNIAGSLQGAAPFLQDRAIDMFGQVDRSFGQNLKRLLQS